MTVPLIDLSHLLNEFENRVRKVLDESKETEFKKLYTPEQTCQLLSISKSTLQRWTRSGYIKAVQVQGSRPKYEAREVDRVILLNTR